VNLQLLAHIPDYTTQGHAAPEPTPHLDGDAGTHSGIERSVSVHVWHWTSPSLRFEIDQPLFDSADLSEQAEDVRLARRTHDRSYGQIVLVDRDLHFSDQFGDRSTFGHWSNQRRAGRGQVVARLAADEDRRHS